MKRLFAFPALLVAFPLVAQEAKPAQAKSISLQDAIRIALIEKNNLQVGIAETTRDFTKANEQIAAGAFDWTLAGSANWSKVQDASLARITTPTGTSYANFESTSYSRSLDVNLNKPFEWGGALKVDYNPTYGIGKSGLAGNPQTYGPIHTPYDEIGRAHV